MPNASLTTSNYIENEEEQFAKLQSQDEIIKRYPSLRVGFFNGFYSSSFPTPKTLDGHINTLRSYRLSQTFPTMSFFTLLWGFGLSTVHASTPTIVLLGSLTAASYVYWMQTEKINQMEMQDLEILRENVYR